MIQMETPILCFSLPLGQGAMALANTVYTPPNLVPKMRALLLE